MDTNENNTLKVTQVKISLFEGYMNTRPIKGIASVILNDQLCLRGIIAMDDKNRIFVDYLWDNTAAFFSMTQELREEIDTAVLDEYIRTSYPKPKGKTEMGNEKKNDGYVICRGYYCGVHAGYLKEREGNHVVLNEARRLWKWKAVKGISLSEVAKYGIDASGSKVCTKCGEIWLGDVYEVIPCTDAARKTIEEVADADIG